MWEIFKSLDLKVKIIIISITVFVIGFIIAIFYFNFFASPKDISEDVIDKNELTNEMIEEYTTGGFSLTNNSKKSIIVHVIGAVNNPGVVQLGEGARIKDAIDASGGQTEDANLSKVNLAYILDDGTQIYIPSVNDKVTDETVLIKQDAGEGVIVESDKTEGNVGKVNINNASLEKLQTLPGVGQATAQKIIDYRNANGKFNQIEDLKKIEGIGDSKFDKLKQYITVK